MHEPECGVDTEFYFSGLCNPEVRPSTIWYLWMLYAVAFSGYFFLSYESRHSKSLKRVIWQDTPETLQWIQVSLGFVSWIILGTYLGIAEGYNTYSLAFFFVLQILYIGLMFWENKKGDPDESFSIELIAVLTLSVLALMIHLFFVGTYAILIIIVFQNSLINDFILYTLGRKGLVHL